MSCAGAPVLTAVAKYVAGTPFVPDAWGFIYSTTDGRCRGGGWVRVRGGERNGKGSAWISLIAPPV